MTAINFDDLKRRLPPDRVVPLWLPHGRRRGHEWVATNPTRSDAKPGSFSVNLTTGAWGDFATDDRGGDVISLYAYLHGLSQIDAARRLSQDYGDAPPAPAPVVPIDKGHPDPIMPVPEDAPMPSFRHGRYGDPSHVWTYRSASGAPLMYVARFDPEGERKQILPRSYVSEGGRRRWKWSGIRGSDPRPLYGLDLLADAPTADVLIVEGEKAADAANRLIADLPMVAVSWMGGCATAARAKLTALHGRRVIIIPDADEPGSETAVKLARNLSHAESVRIVRHGDDLPQGWDLADAEDDGWTGARVAKLVAGAVSLDAYTSGGESGPLPLHSQVTMGTWPQTMKDRPTNTIANVRHLCDSYGIRVRYNEMTHAREITIPGVEYLVDNADANSLTKVIDLAAMNSVPVSRIPEYLDEIADGEAYHPVAEWIRSRPWDGVSRMREVYDTLETTGCPDLRDALVRRWMIACAAAALSPTGVEAHGALILQGDQYIGKSRWVRSLAPRGWIATGKTVDPANKDHLLEALAYWICELGEIDATFRKADVARLKAFVTKDVDEIRRPYARAVSRLPRRTVFYGSVNSRRFLVDETGNRRWWTIPVSAVNAEHSIDMQQVWAEVATFYESGEHWWLSRDENERLAETNAEHESVDPLEELVRGKWDWSSDARPLPMTATDALRAIGYERTGRRESTRMAEILREMTGSDPRKSNGRTLYDLPPVRVADRGTWHDDGDPLAGA